MIENQQFILCYNLKVSGTSITALKVEGHYNVLV